MKKANTNELVDKKSGKAYLTDKDYNFIFANTPRLCVDIIIKNNGLVHLTKRSIPPHKGKYHIPGGRVFFREKIMDALKRICKRELGVTVSSAKFLNYIEFPYENRNGNIGHSVSLAFEVKTRDKLETKKVSEKNILPNHLKFMKTQK